jgi:ribonuclease HI
VVITTPRGRVVDRIARGIGIATNNVAEYTAVLEGLQRARELGATDVLLRSDSKLLIEQLSGRFRVKNPTLQRLHTEVRTTAKAFSTIRYQHVLREMNGEADRMANRGVDEWLAGEGASWSATERAPSLWEEPE